MSLKMPSRNVKKKRYPAIWRKILLKFFLSWSVSSFCSCHYCRSSILPWLPISLSLALPIFKSLHEVEAHSLSSNAVGERPQESCDLKLFYANMTFFGLWHLLRSYCFFNAPQTWIVAAEDRAVRRWKVGASPFVKVLEIILLLYVLTEQILKYHEKYYKHSTMAWHFTAIYSTLMIDLEWK